MSSAAAVKKWARFSFSPAHALAAHRPLGGINRARLIVYTAMSDLRRRANEQPIEEAAGLEEIPG